MARLDHQAEWISNAIYIHILNDVYIYIYVIMCVYVYIIMYIYIYMCVTSKYILINHILLVAYPILVRFFVSQ